MENCNENKSKKKKKNKKKPRKMLGERSIKIKSGMAEEKNL